jgi:transposase-like protein
MARYGQEFKTKATARLLPPNTSSIEEVSREVGVSADTLQRWRAARSAWRREHGKYPQKPAACQASPTKALSEP